MVKEVEEGKRETIVVHPPSVVKDTETYSMKNDPMRVFWSSCVRVETNDVHSPTKPNLVRIQEVQGPLLHAR
jgi:hypothetical protein